MSHFRIPALRTKPPHFPRSPAAMDIGVHCSVGACNQVDFLPFTCDCCKSVFCLRHRTYDAHECPLAGSKDRRVITCPLCSASLHWTLEQDVNIVWEDHVRGGNCGSDSSNAGRTLGGTNAPKKKKKPRCAAAQCREILTASNQFSCTKCRQNVCMKHRFESDHDCANARSQLRQQQQQQSWSLAGFSRSQSNSTAHRRSSSSAAPSTAKLQQNARQAATSVVNGTKSAVNSLVQNAKAAATSASAASANLITTNSEECPICQKKFAYVSQLIAHVNNAHPENASSRQSASSSASRPIDLTSSPASAGSGAREVCPQCRAEFSDVAALIRHAETAHAASVAASASGASSSSGGQEKCSIS